MWNIIPQVFYDFLARLIPGAAIIAVTNITLQGRIASVDFALSSPGSDKLSATGLIFLWALGSYLMGFLLGQFWEMTLGRLTKRMNENIEKECQEKCLAGHNCTQRALGCPEVAIAPGNLPTIVVMRDHIRHVAPGEASRLLKIRAERRMCQVLLLGFFALSIVNGAYLVTRLEAARIVLEISLIVAMAPCWSGAQRLYRHLATGTTVSWLVLIAAQNTAAHKDPA